MTKHQCLVVKVANQYLVARNLEGPDCDGNVYYSDGHRVQSTSEQFSVLKKKPNKIDEVFLQNGTRKYNLTFSALEKLLDSVAYQSTFESDQELLHPFTNEIKTTQQHTEELLSKINAHQITNVSPLHVVSFSDPKEFDFKNQSQSPEMPRGQRQDKNSSCPKKKKTKLSSSNDSIMTHSSEVHDVQSTSPPPQSLKQSSMDCFLKPSSSLPTSAPESSSMSVTTPESASQSIPNSTSELTLLSSSSSSLPSMPIMVDGNEEKEKKHYGARDYGDGPYPPLEQLRAEAETIHDYFIDRHCFQFTPEIQDINVIFSYAVIFYYMKNNVNWDLERCEILNHYWQGSFPMIHFTGGIFDRQKIGDRWIQSSNLVRLVIWCLVCHRTYGYVRPLTFFNTHRSGHAINDMIYERRNERTDLSTFIHTTWPFRCDEKNLYICKNHKTVTLSIEEHFLKRMCDTAYDNHGAYRTRMKSLLTKIHAQLPSWIFAFFENSLQAHVVKK